MVINYKECPVCEKEFRPSLSFMKYCSDFCRTVANSRASRRYYEESKSKRLKPFSKCAVCDKDFQKVHLRKTCSLACSDELDKRTRSERQKRVRQFIKTEITPSSCLSCGSMYMKKRKDQKGCSEECKKEIKLLEAGEWYRKNKERRKANLRRCLYGISNDQYDTLIKDQLGNCAICNNALDMARNTHVDHDHQPPFSVRGILCNFCNSGLGMFKDDAWRLGRAISYLEKHREEREDAAMTIGDEELY